MHMYIRTPTDRHMGSAFNQLAADFLSDIGRVFPDDRVVAQASALVSAAVSMNERSILPAVAFMDGMPQEEWAILGRGMFQIPARAMESFVEHMTSENKAIMQRYVDNMATLLTKTYARKDQLNAVVANLKQGDTMQEIQNILANPHLIMQFIQDPGKIESLGNGLLANPQLKQIMETLQPMMTAALLNLGPHLQQGALNNLPIPGK